MFKPFHFFKNLKKRTEIFPEPDPVFIFAASWRTGSTLTQRIINASGQIFIWGEPAYLPDAKMLFNKLQKHLAKNQGCRKKAFSQNVGAWIPVVSPYPEQAVQAFKAFFNELYAREVHDMGIKRWGFKEVRPNALPHMAMLNTIFPQARFIFLVRDPYDAYRSVKAKKFHSHFKDPFQPIKVWNNNVYDFLNQNNLKSSVMLVKHEDLSVQTRKSSQTLKKLCAHTALCMTDKMFQELEVKTDSSGWNTNLTDFEINSITEIISQTAPKIGYSLR